VDVYCSHSLDGKRKWNMYLIFSLASTHHKKIWQQPFEVGDEIETEVNDGYWLKGKGFSIGQYFSCMNFRKVSGRNFFQNIEGNIWV